MKRPSQQQPTSMNPGGALDATRKRDSAITRTMMLIEDYDSAQERHDRLLAMRIQHQESKLRSSLDSSTGSEHGIGSRINFLTRLQQQHQEPRHRSSLDSSTGSDHGIPGTRIGLLGLLRNNPITFSRRNIHEHDETQQGRVVGDRDDAAKGSIITGEESNLFPLVEESPTTTKPSSRSVRKERPGRRNISRVRSTKRKAERSLVSPKTNNSNPRSTAVVSRPKRSVVPPSA